MGMKIELCPNPEKLGRELKLVLCPWKFPRNFPEIPQDPFKLFEGWNLRQRLFDL